MWVIRAPVSLPWLSPGPKRRCNAFREDQVVVRRQGKDFWIYGTPGILFQPLTHQKEHPKRVILFG